MSSWRWPAIIWAPDILRCIGWGCHPFPVVVTSSQSPRMSCRFYHDTFLPSTILTSLLGRGTTQSFLRETNISNLVKRKNRRLKKMPDRKGYVSSQEGAYVLSFTLISSSCSWLKAMGEVRLLKAPSASPGQRCGMLPKHTMIGRIHNRLVSTNGKIAVQVLQK